MNYKTFGILFLSFFGFGICFAQTPSSTLWGEFYLDNNNRYEIEMVKAFYQPTQNLITSSKMAYYPGEQDCNSLICEKCILTVTYQAGMMDVQIIQNNKEITKTHAPFIVSTETPLPVIDNQCPQEIPNGIKLIASNAEPIVMDFITSEKNKLKMYFDFLFEKFQIQLLDSGIKSPEILKFTTANVSVDDHGNWFKRPFAIHPPDTYKTLKTNLENAKNSTPSEDNY